MGHKLTAIAYLDAERLLRALSAGIGYLFQRREYLNRINVFPVPDGDTGTNMAFTFKTILEATATSPDTRVDDLMDHIAEAALDGARGNSGAIMAQYFHGFREAVSGRRLLSARDFAKASTAGAKSAWTAMSQPVQGTLPTVLDDFSQELASRAAAGLSDIRTMLRHGLERAKVSLANTPNQLPVLKEAGVVDAGGQGFVDLLEGIWTYIEKGAVSENLELPPEVQISPQGEFDVGEHQFCTECVIEGDDLRREVVMARMQALDASSLVVAGGRGRVRVHIHVNNPADVFLTCGELGRITQQKADDMHKQHGLLNHSGVTAIVTDSGGDVPPSEVERLSIHVVPVRLSFGDREYLDGVSLTAAEFCQMLESSDELPLTSQPPAKDFARIYSLLTSHGYSVVSVGLSEKLSGTTGAARLAAERTDTGSVTVFDSFSAGTGQGLLAVAAAEAAAMGMSSDDIIALLEEMRPQTRVIAVANDLTSAVKGGRVPAIVKRITDFLHINPVLTASPEGKMTLGGFHLGRGARPVALARTAVRKMDKNVVYRVMISHMNNEEGAQETRRNILQKHGRIHSCHLSDAGPALGVHLGLGGIIVGFMPQPALLV
jgi:DegV family protein with EDD domain